jgi:hypothetical protein
MREVKLKPFTLQQGGGNPNLGLPPYIGYIARRR